MKKVKNSGLPFEALLLVSQKKKVTVCVVSDIISWQLLAAVFGLLTVGPMAWVTQVAARVVRSLANTRHHRPWDIKLNKGL